MGKEDISLKTLEGGKEADVEPSRRSQRGEWGNHLEFMLSVIGYSIGFGNIWRFPYVCFDNGGGAFLIPYLVMLFLIGKPLYFMELSLGQYTREGPPGAFKLTPIAMGVGYAMLFTCLIICIYYNVLMAYTLFYTFASFQKHLPWARCDNAFNTKFCFDAFTNIVPSARTNLSLSMLNTTVPITKLTTDNAFATYNTSLNLTSALDIVQKNVSSMEEFWKIRVLGFDRSPGIHNLGGVKWDLALILLLSWLIVFAMLFKGIQSAGKAIYVTATLPYLLLTILLIRGVTLNGAVDGIKFLFTPQWGKLLDIKVWRAACAQMFYSLSLALGGILTFSSFNPFRNNCYKDAMVVSVMDTVTSLIASTVIFSYLGNMAQEMNIPLSEASDTLSGPGLVFIVYPRAVARLPVPQLWSVLFFVMLYSLGLDSEIALLQTVSSAIHDQLPTIFPWKYKTYLCGALCFLCYLLGLPFVTYGGFYIFDLINFYVGDFCLIMIAAAELIAIMWIYGFKRFVGDIEMMLGRRLPQRWYWVMSWAFFGPVILVALALASFYDLITAGEHKLDTYSYPRWAHGIGWSLTIIILASIFIVGFIYVIKQPGTTLLQKIKNACEPSKDFWLKDCDYTAKDFDVILKEKLDNLG